MGKNKVKYMSKINEYETPIPVFETLHAAFKFTLDPCATDQNAKCKRYYTSTENGLKQSWKDEVVFMHPPYGKLLPFWVRKAYEESQKNNATVVCLLPVWTDRNFWHDWVFNKSEVVFLRGRLTFENHKQPAPFASAIVTFHPPIKKEVKNSDSEKIEDTN